MSRSEENRENCWESTALGACGETLGLAFGQPTPVREIRLTFDTDLSHEIMPSITKIVRDYTVTLRRNGQTIEEKEVRGNGQRLNVHQFNKVLCDEVLITVTGTHGLDRARIYEVRIY